MKYNPITEDSNHELIINYLKDDQFGWEEYPEFGITYDLNSFNYRSEEFDGSASILILGCSQTFGLGLPYEYTWPQLLSKMTGLKVANLAKPGESAQGQIRKAFSYFKSFGQPKYIFCLFPIHRAEFIHVPDKNRIKPHLIEKRKSVQMDPTDESYSFLKFSKAPHHPDQVLAPEFSLYMTHLFLDILEQYCKMGGIEFKWATYDSYKDIYTIINDKDKEYYKNFILPLCLEYRGEHSWGEDDCYLEYTNNRFFDTAIDNSHFGIHMNIHIAETFYAYVDREAEVPSEN